MRKAYIGAAVLFVLAAIFNPLLGEISKDGWALIKESWRAYHHAQAPKLPPLPAAKEIATAPIGEPRDVQPSVVATYDPYAKSYDPYADTGWRPGDCCQPAKAKRSSRRFTDGYFGVGGGFGDPGTCCDAAKPKKVRKAAGSTRLANRRDTGGSDGGGGDVGGCCGGDTSKVRYSDYPDWGYPTVKAAHGVSFDYSYPTDTPKLDRLNR